MVTFRVAVYVSTAVLWIVAASLALAHVYSLAEVPYTVNHAATVDALHQTEWSTHYGFGEHKRLIVINMTDIGGMMNIDPSDKKHATMRVYGSSLHDGEDDEDGTTLYDIGLEYKGTEYYDFVQRGKKNPQPSLLFGIWKWDDDKDEWDDDDERLFFKEKMEDFVLRAGCMDPTLVREYAAPYMAGASYERTLVEVLLVHAGDRVTYEGVYMLAQHLKRRMLDKNGHIASSGKKGDCDDVDDGDDMHELVDQTLLQFQLDIPKEDTEPCIRSQAYLRGRDETFRPMYPTCKHLLADKMTRCGMDDVYLSAYEGLVNITLGEIDPEHPPPELVLPVTMANMASTLITELLLTSDNFGWESDHMFAHPLADGETVRALQTMLWDFDEQNWRLRNPDSKDVAFTKSFKDPKDASSMWKFYADYEPFLALVRASGPVWLQEAHTVLQSVIADRRAEHTAGYWDRHDARWNFYGKQWTSKDNDFMLLFVPGGYTHALTKSTPAKELDFMEDWVTRRAASITAWLPTAKAGDVRFLEYDVDLSIMGQAVPAVVFTILAILWTVWSLLLWFGLCGPSAPANSQRLPTRSS